VINGRDQRQLDRSAASLREQCPEAEVTPVVGDVSTSEGRDRLLSVCDAPDILVTNNAGPVPGPFELQDEQAWLDALSGNMLAALMLIREVLPGMRQRGFGRIVNITSAMVTTPRTSFELSSGPRAGLTAVVKALAREVAPDGVTINNLLPERFVTDRLEYMIARDAEENDITPEAAAAQIAETIAARRFGRVEELGATCAFLCGTLAGYLTGANIHLDGGSYPGLI
jgi:3-oxoacyl-[acyl-carrier protein] reductase